MKNILIDTDILINFLREKKEAKNFLFSIMGESDIYCSVITVAEIHSGMKENEREKTEELIGSLNIIDVTKEIAEKAGKYKRDERKHSLELDDCIVAASAFAKNAVLATGNGKHYPMNDLQKIIVNEG